MPFTAPDPTQVADLVLPDGSSITVRKGWLGDQMWIGQKTLAMEHRAADGTLGHGTQGRRWNAEVARHLGHWIVLPR
jgi:hypothetical protein